MRAVSSVPMLRRPGVFFAGRAAAGHHVSTRPPRRKGRGIILQGFLWEVLRRSTRLCRSRSRHVPYAVEEWIWGRAGDAGDFAPRPTVLPIYQIRNAGLFERYMPYGPTGCNSKTRIPVFCTIQGRSFRASAVVFGRNIRRCVQKERQSLYCYG